MTISRGWLVRAVPLALLIGSVAFAAGDSKGIAPERKPSNLSAQDMLAQSKDFTSKMQETLRRVIQLQERARKAKDIIMLNCVNDKLMQVRGHLLVNGQANAALNEAIAKGDDAGREHEYSRMLILHQKIALLGTEAENCVGQDLSYVGAAKLEVEVDAKIPKNDTTDVGIPRVDVTRPPVASTTL